MSHPKGRGTGDDRQDIQLAIGGARGPACVRTIESALHGVPGVSVAQMNLADRTVRIRGRAKTDSLVRAVQAVGYDAAPVRDPGRAEQQREEQEYRLYRKLIGQTVLSLSVGTPILLWGWLGGSTRVTPHSIAQLAWAGVAAITLCMLAFPGRHFFVGAWNALRQHNANMDTLIALGTAGAWCYSVAVVAMPGLLPAQSRHVYFEASPVIIGLVNLGLALELRARGKASAALRQLLTLGPGSARVVDEDGGERDVPVTRVRAGQRLRVRPGETLAVDGEVLAGKADVAESMLTGEPMPVRKGPGSVVAAGTLVRDGTLLYRATRVGADTALARIIDLVKRAQGAKLPIARLVDRLAGVFVPTVLLIAVATALLWYDLGPTPPLPHMVVAVVSVLIVACPSAVGLATPLPVMVAVGKAARSGMLIRQDTALQTATGLDTVVLDKTGTLTEGRPWVSRVIATEGEDQDNVLRLAAAVEAGSQHPLARAILDAARARGLHPEPVTDFHRVAGKGVSASLNGQTLRLGSHRWLQEQGIAIGLDEHTRALSEDAGTPLFLARDQDLVGVIGIGDRVKEEAPEAVARLHRRGIKVILITGDVLSTARAVARRAGIEEVLAEVLPEDKAKHLVTLQQAGHTVAMVGDGINDAPALAQADVGFAIGTGTDVAMESAHITLMGGSLHGVADAIALSRATMRNVRQNLFGAFLYNCLGIPLAAGALFPFTGWLLSPIIASVAMSLSSLTVVGNANRMRGFEPRLERRPRRREARR